MTVTLIEEARAYLAGPDSGEHHLIRRLADELERSAGEEIRLSLEVKLCRRRLSDLISAGNLREAHG